VDLTKNKKSEKNSNSAERFEKLYTMLLNAIPSSVLMIDQDLRIVSANRNYLTKNRRTESNTIHRRLEEIFPAVILEQIDIIGQIHEVFNRNEATRGQRMSYRSPSVPMRIFYYRIIPFSWKGVVENVMFLMDDVTEQIRLSEEVRRVERHMASVFESASDIILSTDMDGRILSWNPAAEKISSYTFNEVKKKRFFNYIAQEFQKDIKQQFLKMMNTQRPQMAEWDFVTKNGSKIPVAWVSSPMKNERSQPTGIVIVGRDLTERRKLKIQLLRSQKYAALGVMAGGIAHEIRNPLAICSSAAQFLMDDDTTPEFRMECTEKIYTAIQRASIIIENLLRFARPTGKYDMMPVNLPDLIQETLVLISNQAKIQKVELIVDIPEATVAVNCNASLLQQVFINIFLNGIQALPHGGTLSVTLENLGKNVFVLITDNGQGISKENIDKIFDPFYTTSPVGQGTGLGLSICYSIVKQHNGFIGVESVEGKGSTFTVRLPVLSALTRTNRKSYR
jgi:PAS domain S-box-containing protein